ncbi:RidA family protein [Mycolicibacterium phlei]
MSSDLTPPAPRGDYVPAVLHNGVVHTAGMTPRRGGELVFRGAVGDGLSLDEGRQAAALAAANAVAAVRSVAGADAAVRCLRMTVYVACVPGFEELSAVADGASATIRELLGTAVLPARSAIGVLALPSGAPVEVELTAAVLD